MALAKVMGPKETLPPRLVTVVSSGRGAPSVSAEIVKEKSPSLRAGASRPFATMALVAFTETTASLVPYSFTKERPPSGALTLATSSPASFTVTSTSTRSAPWVTALTPAGSAEVSSATS